MTLPVKSDRYYRETHVGAVVVVHRGLGHHGVVLQLRLPQRRGVRSDEDELRLSGAERLQSAAVSEDDLAGLDDKGQLETFVVSSCSSRGISQAMAVRTLAPMDWASFLFFLGAIATVVMNDCEE